MNQSPTLESLVLYRNRPARVTAEDDQGKLRIELPDGKSQRVRQKDIFLLHQGPVSSLAALHVSGGEVQAAWELLAGEQSRLSELAELVYGEHSPATAWATWELVADGLYFSGTPDRVVVHSARDVDSIRAERESRLREAAEWEGFLERLRKHTCDPEDAGRLTEVEALADGRTEKSKTLKALGREETAQNAHDLLLKIGYWDNLVNPFPRRLGLSLRVPDDPVPDLRDEARSDLTGLMAFAIDDEDNEDPDDAVSWDGERLWVHVADVAALVHPDDPLDRLARERGANLYLPERTVPMLPPGVTERLGLGLHEESPALSLGLRVDPDGGLSDGVVVLSRVRVSRVSYSEAEGMLDQEPFASLARLTGLYRERRRTRGAAFIELPEVRIKVMDDGSVQARPLPRTKSRELVMDAMLMAGEAVARFALEHTIPFPFSTQPAGDPVTAGPGLAGMYARRRQMRRSQMRAVAEPHSGLGIGAYSQATSPLRRYLDLVLHQQLRAWLVGDRVLDLESVMQRVGEADLLIGSVRRAERQSNLHWTLVFLSQNPNWRGTGVVVESKGRSATVLIPSLAYETRLNLGREVQLNTEIELECKGVNLPAQTAGFRVLPAST